MLLAQLMCIAFLFRSVKERADVHFVTTCTIALNALVFVWMIKALNCGVALATLDAAVAVVPSRSVL